MTSISIEALREKTLIEIEEIERQARNLPEGFKIKFKTPKVQSAEELLEELQ